MILNSVPQKFVCPSNKRSVPNSQHLQTTIFADYWKSRTPLQYHLSTSSKLRLVQNALGLTPVSHLRQFPKIYASFIPFMLLGSARTVTNPKKQHYMLLVILNSIFFPASKTRAERTKSRDGQEIFYSR